MCFASSVRSCRASHDRLAQLDIGAWLQTRNALRRPRPPSHMAGSSSIAAVPARTIGSYRTPAPGSKRLGSTGSGWRPRPTLLSACDKAAQFDRVPAPCRLLRRIARPIARTRPFTIDSPSQFRVRRPCREERRGRRFQVTSSMPPPESPLGDATYSPDTARNIAAARARGATRSSAFRRGGHRVAGH